MNRGALDRPTFETIEAYVLERMTAPERANFEQRMAGDAVLRDEVELERENIRAVELGGIGRAMKQIATEERAEAATHGRGISYLAYAAAVTALVLGALWWHNRSSVNERLFAEHFTPDPGLPVAMGAADDLEFADAMVSYKEGNYAEARAKWSRLLKSDAGSDTMRFYIASASLAEGDAASAIAPLTALVTDSTSVFQSRAAWYLFLAHLRMGQYEKARAVDLSASPDRRAKAEAILAEMER